MVNFLTIALIVIIGTPLTILFFYILSKTKGKIKIELDKSEVKYGEKITGTIILKLKKSKLADSLSIRLIGMSRTNPAVSMIASGGHYSNQRDYKVFDFKKLIQGKGEYPMGEHRVRFEINVPSDPNQRESEGWVGGVFLKIQSISSFMTFIRWSLKASLEIPGFNISKKVRINIS